MSFTSKKYVDAKVTKETDYRGLRIEEGRISHLGLVRRALELLESYLPCHSESFSRPRVIAM
jgi:hypothetical protein